MSVSEQAQELRTAFARSLELLGALVENRSAWSDAISGCREALVIVTDAAEKLKAIYEDAQQGESDLVSARAENVTLGRNYSDLEQVEQALRTERDQLAGELKTAKAEVERSRSRHSSFATREKGLRADLDELRLALVESRAAVAAEAARCREQQATWSANEQQLRAELERLNSASEQCNAAMASARSLVKKLETVCK